MNHPGSKQKLMAYSFGFSRRFSQGLGKKLSYTHQ